MRHGKYHAVGPYDVSCEHCRPAIVAAMVFGYAIACILSMLASKGDEA